ncbi:Pro-Pol polyprotein [Frankliniella fusca]|uniref:Pro-Pol polyprotein n=1 Tax=Frankliniella fusca TaxID=407009 RepID=A0AAE1HCN4_9NEOP|nr:Pro-Pol polyprotein [Frankliniella fusca]
MSKYVLSLFGIRKSSSLALHPASNGKVERFMQVITSHLARMVSQDQSHWDEVLPLVMMTCRATQHAATKYSPAEVMFGTNTTLPANLVRPLPTDMEGPAQPALYPAWLRDTLRRVHEDVRQNNSTAQVQDKEYYDAAGTNNPIRVGQEVWLWSPRRRRGRCPRLDTSWVGLSGGESPVGRHGEDLAFVRDGGKKTQVAHARAPSPLPPPPAPSIPAEVTLTSPAAPPWSLADLDAMYDMELEVGDLFGDDGGSVM